MFKIEKHIPVPPKHNKGSSIYPFAQMQKGDSFLIPAKAKEEQVSKRKAVSASAYKHKMKITTRIVEGGVRVWKVA